jgi:hypothetical protein
MCLADNSAPLQLRPLRGSLPLTQADNAVSLAARSSVCSGVFVAGFTILFLCVLSSAMYAPGDEYGRQQWALDA